ncbi:MAG TPA: c-type cytochrome [Steroidobacteraceae bacterium]|nr:c-type cytochrome [Steroidobacteraceae bacterium]
MIGMLVHGSLVLVLAATNDATIAPTPPRAAIATAGEELREVLAATPDRERGAQLFSICRTCHGPRGEGNASGWPPEIAGQHRRVIARELVDFRAGLRWYDPMERIAGRHVLHTTQDIADVAAYVGSLVPSQETSTGSGRWVARGADLYARHCRSCHGAQGEGSDLQFVPRVGGQQFEYLLRQLNDSVSGQRPNMQPTHRQLLGSLGADDLAGIADYMSRLGRSGRPPDASAARSTAADDGNLSRAASAPAIPGLRPAPVPAARE